MATSVWGIDIGQCALKAIKLRYDSKEDRAIAEAFDYIEHPKILSQPDAEPEEMIRQALDKFLERNEVQGSTLAISVPGQAGLARFVKLPPVESKKIPDIVTFEAKQQIPFALNEVVWDYQKIGGTGEEEGGFSLETEVAIFAIKRDQAQKNLAPFVEKGLEVDLVQLAPMALYNFAAYDHIYLTRKSAAAAKPSDEAKEQSADSEPPAENEAEEEEEGDTYVILDIGADKTDVVITDGDSIWQRTLPIGGNHFTRALTKELKLTFAKAEHLKRNATKAPDPKRLYQAMRPVFQDLASELQKSIGYFATTHRQQTIKEVVGVGNGFRLAGLAKFLHQNLDYNVIQVNQFKGLGGDEVLSAPAFVGNLPGFCIAYGLALQGLGQTPIQTNLLPRDIQLARLIRGKKSFSLLSVAAVLLGCVFIYLGNWRMYSAVHARTFKEPVEAAKKAVQEFAGWDAAYKAEISQFDSKKTAAADLIGLEAAKGRLGWIRILKTINDALPARDFKASDADLAKIAEVNVEYIQASYKPDLNAWFTAFNDSAKGTLSEKDKAAPPAGAGWVFSIIGYTFNASDVVFLQHDVLKRFQSDDIRAQGITHAILAEWKEDEEWTPAKPSWSEGRVKLKSAFGGAAPGAGAVGGGAVGGLAAAAVDGAAATPGYIHDPNSDSPVAINSGAPAKPAEPANFEAKPGESGDEAFMRAFGEVTKKPTPAPNPTGDPTKLNLAPLFAPKDFRIGYQVKSAERAVSQATGADAGSGFTGIERTDFEIQFVWVPPPPPATTP